MGKLVGWFVAAVLATYAMVTLGLASAVAGSAQSPFARVTERLTFGLAHELPGVGLWSSMLELRGSTAMVGVMALAGVLFFCLWRIQSIRSNMQEIARRRLSHREIARDETIREEVRQSRRRRPG